MKSKFDLLTVGPLAIVGSLITALTLSHHLIALCGHTAFLNIGNLEGSWLTLMMRRTAAHSFQNHIWRDSVYQFCKHSFDPKKPVVIFHGEKPVDGGGPGREYFRLLCVEIEEVTVVLLKAPGEFQFHCFSRSG